MFGAFELAETATDPEERRRRLTFAAGRRRPDRRGARRADPRAGHQDAARRSSGSIRPEDARVLLFDGGDAPLASFGPALSAKAAATLEDLGVELHLGTLVTEVDGDGLVVRDRSGATVRHDAGDRAVGRGCRRPAAGAALAAATGASDRPGRADRSART